MEKYELYYRDVLIGILEINNSTYYYKSIENNQDILSFLKEDMDYLHPFLESRITKMKRFNLTELKYLTDNYELRKINQSS